MLTRFETNKVNGQTSTCPSRADSIQGWATKGARAFTAIQRKPLHISPRPHSILCRESWFGSNGKCTGYTPKGVETLLAGQDITAFRHGIVSSVIQHYKKRFKFITVKRACQILSKIGSGEDIFYWVHLSGREQKWTVHKILEQQAKNRLSNWYADDISLISFTGGPPNRWDTYRGSLFTLLLDRIAVIVLFEGMKALDNVITPTERYTVFA